MLGTGTPAFVLALVCAQESLQVGLCLVEAVVVEIPGRHSQVHLGKGGCGLQRFLKVLESFLGVVGKQHLAFLELGDGLLVVNSVLGQHHRCQHRQHSEEYDTFYIHDMNITKNMSVYCVVCKDSTGSDNH